MPEALIPATGQFLILSYTCTQVTFCELVKQTPERSLLGCGLFTNTDLTMNRKFSYFFLCHNRATKIPSQPWGWVKQSVGPIHGVVERRAYGGGLLLRALRSLFRAGTQARRVKVLDTFQCVVPRHLREAGTRRTSPHTVFFLVTAFHSIVFLGNDFQLGEIKGKVQFSLCLLFIFTLLP